MFLSKGHRDLRFAFQTHPGSPALFLGEAKYSAFLSSPNGYLLSPQSGLKGGKPPAKFGEKTRDCSPGHPGLQQETLGSIDLCQ